ncbi:SpoVK/Ycf46/Vps4 family AAA+-type ATPase [Bradyrhizobium japonicum]|uniref:AAA family ATPase n=1 Tax=Bradyrhizobium japonicum TaxID=375 RepID=UPI0033916F51
MLQSTVEALAADERAKRHTILADQLTRALAAPSPSRVFSGGGGSGARDGGLEFLSERVPQLSLASLHLRAVVRSSLMDLVEEQIRADLLRSHGLEPRHRLLLAGPPGNGKTSVAEGIAEALALPLYSVRYDTLIGSFLGETNQRLKRMFEYIRSRPAVVFFDEFDVVGKERGDPHETGEIKRVVSTLLLQIDSLPSYNVVIAATNHSELLDRAVWRRFELRVELPSPSTSELADYFERAFSRMPMPLDRRRASRLAASLGNLSFAEAQDFVLDVRRKLILGLGEMPLEKVLDEKIRAWLTRGKRPSDGNRSKQTASAVAKRRRSPANRKRK